MLVLAHHPPELGSLDLDKDIVEKVGRGHQSAEPAPFQSQEITCQLRQSLAAKSNRPEGQYRRYLRSRLLDRLDITSIIDVGQAQGPPNMRYGHPQVAVGVAA